MLFRSGGWAERLEQGAVFADANAAKAGVAKAEADMKANRVVEIMPVDVEITPQGPKPTHLRDKIRVAGPTVHRDHGKQAS